MQYSFEESRENAWSLAALIMVWVGTAMYLMAIIPNVAMTRWWKYPSVVTHSIELTVLILLQTVIWSCYEGTQQYICRSDNSDFVQMISEHLSSGTCIAQEWIFVFFFVANLMWLCVLSLSIAAQMFGFECILWRVFVGCID
jgi:hypothetical protein